MPAVDAGARMTPGAAIVYRYEQTAAQGERRRCKAGDPTLWPDFPVLKGEDADGRRLRVQLPRTQSRLRPIVSKDPLQEVDPAREARWLG